MKHLHLWLTFAGAATLAQFLGFFIPTIISWKLVNLGILNPDEPFVWMPLISLMLTACILSLLLIQLVLGRLLRPLQRLSPSVCRRTTGGRRSARQTRALIK